ncbi:MAG: Hsp20/alpha crystallin family protein [Gemmatimonadota bacterium]|nr:Hsp20/alpha crystallin family protein [Gemmatimonadota bacterium]
MSLIKHTNRFVPLNDFDVLANRMNRLFGDTGLGNLTYASSWVPPVSVEEKGGEILLTAELPGMAEDAVEINLENNVLTISGEKRESREEGVPGGKYHLAERSFGSFRRSFTLPRTVRADGITADFENGLLTVSLPKAEEAVSRKIEVSRRES